VSLLPTVSMEMLRGCSHDLHDAQKRGAATDAEALQQMKVENPVLYDFLCGMAVRAPSEAQKVAYLKGATRTYHLLRRQAEIDELNKDFLG